MSQELVWVRKVKRGNKKAFKKLFDANADRLYRFLLQFSRDTDLVKDWVQRAFIKAYERIDTFEGRSRFSTWLFRIAINEMRTDQRKIQRLNETELEDGSDLISNNDTNFEWDYDMKLILSQLDETKRAIFILYEVEGYSHAEVSDLLNISEAASRTTLFRTKKLLQDMYKKQRGVG